MQSHNLKLLQFHPAAPGKMRQPPNAPARPHWLRLVSSNGLGLSPAKQRQRPIRRPASAAFRTLVGANWSRCFRPEETAMASQVPRRVWQLPQVLALAPVASGDQASATARALRSRKRSLARPSFETRKASQEETMGIRHRHPTFDLTPTPLPWVLTPYLQTQVCLPKVSLVSVKKITRSPSCDPARRGPR